MSSQETKADLLRQHLAGVIDQGLEPHSKLPAERELATEFEVSRLTVRRALDRMEQEGLVYRVQGAGTFVAAPRITKSVELTSFSEDMRSRGLEPGSRLLIGETVAAGARYGAKLQVSPAQDVLHIRRVRTADGEPMCLEDTYLNPARFPGLMQHIGNESLYRVMETRYGARIEWAEQSIHASVLGPQDAEILHAPAFSPAFFVTRTSFDTMDRPIEYAESTYRADRYHYELRIQRNR